MAGRQGHNARKGKQGFQEVYSGPPAEYELPEMPDTDSDDDVPLKATPKEEAQAMGFLSIISGGMAAGTLLTYLPAGGSPVIGFGALATAAVVQVVATFIVARYFIRKRKGLVQ